MTTAALPNGKQTITVTHPFSPLKGQELYFIERIKVGGEDKIICCDKDRKSRTVLTSWTDYPSDEPTYSIAGTVDFRFEDLQMLAKLINDINKV